MKKMNWYYEIWADAIDKAENSKSNQSHRHKMGTLLAIFSVAQGFNLVCIFFLISTLIKFNPFIAFNVFPGNYLNIALSGIVTLFVPFALLNYFLIFYKNKYKNYIAKKKLNTGGKAFMLYFVFSVLIFFLIVFLGKIL
jgi:hypothetical protein